MKILADDKSLPKERLQDKAIQDEALKEGALPEEQLDEALNDKIFDDDVVDDNLLDEVDEWECSEREWSDQLNSRPPSKQMSEKTKMTRLAIEDWHEQRRIEREIDSLLDE